MPTGPGPITIDTLDDATAKQLHDYNFDAASFQQNQNRLRDLGVAGLLEANRLSGPIAPPNPETVVPLPSFDDRAHRELREEGAALLRQGRVGAVVLAGGMATRFGGVVKANVPVLGKQTFLDLKLANFASLGRSMESTIPAFVMSSFATDGAIGDALAQRAPDACEAERFAQRISLRLREDGELFLNREQKPSLYAPGHGDLGDCLRASGCLARFEEQGGELLFVSNVDNLMATLDPVLIALHRRSGKQVSVEVVDKQPGDKGGAPAHYAGRDQIIEAFRFPEDFDQDSIPVFNTNTFLFEASALRTPQPLEWFGAQKQVAGEAIIQFERLAGQLSAYLDTQYLRVPRTGREARFYPIKDPTDLERGREALAKRLAPFLS